MTLVLYTYLALWLALAVYVLGQVFDVWLRLRIWLRNWRHYVRRPERKGFEVVVKEQKRERGK